MLAFTYSLLIAASTVAVPVEVQKLDGGVVQGRFRTLTDNGAELEVAGEATEIPFRLIQTIRFSRRAATRFGETTAWVRLVDGSLLVTTRYATSGSQASLQMPDGTELQIQTRYVRSVRFHAQDPKRRRQWEAILQTQVRGDLIATRKDDRIDYIEGVLGMVNAETVHFQLDDELIPVRLGKVEGIVYHHASPDGLPLPVVRVSDVDGSQLAVSQWSVDGRGLRLQLPSGIRLRRDFHQLRQIDFSSDKIVYLSDLEPASIDWQPYLPQEPLMAVLRQFYQPRRDRALGVGPTEGDDGKLQLWMGSPGKSLPVPFEKGLALHSRTRLLYPLPAGVRSFRALAGIDARVRRHGHVRLVIRGDQRELFAQDIAGSQPPREIALNLTGVQLLEILVDFGQNQDIGDHLNLCNARLIK
ncbi:MAG: hypothetical protein GTO03_06985 [Planctomycetales bacterium]|nr:hypothetical protein [Planctomycetales bacterium]